MGSNYEAWAHFDRLRAAYTTLLKGTLPGS